MNPEQMVALMERVQQARAAGFSDAEIAAELADITGGSIASVRDLRRAEMEAKAHAARPTPQRTADEALQMGQGALLDWGDEIGGVLAGLGAAIVPGGKGFSEARRDATQAIRRRVAEADERGGAIRNRIGGGLLTTGLGTAARGAAQGINILAHGPLAAPARMIGRMGSRAAVGGAAVGATEAAGAAEGGVRERLPETAFGAGLGAATGLLGGTVAAAAREVPRAFRTARQVGTNVAGELRRLSGHGQTPTSLLQAEQKAAQKAARESLIKPLEGQPAPPAITQAFLDAGDPDVTRTLQRELRAIRGRNPNAREVLDDIGRVLEGKQERLTTEISFETADELARGMTERARRALRMGRAEEAANLSSAFEVLDENLRTLPGYSEFKGEWARTSANMRALVVGRKLASPSVSADDVSRALAALPTDEARKFALDAMANQYAFRLESRLGKSGQVSAIMDAGPDFQRKLRQMFPDDASFNEFKRFVDIERASISTAERARVIGQGLAFLTAGSSIFARLLPTPGN